MVSGYKISSNNEDMDLLVIHNCISRSYWAKGIPIETMERAINNSLCFGVFTFAGEQVGFARVVTDYATFGNLVDVFVLEQHRGKGLSKWLMQSITENQTLQGLRRITLATRDAHELYNKYGFTALKSPNVFMELHRPNIYTE